MQNASFRDVAIATPVHVLHGQQQALVTTTEHKSTTP